MISLVCGVKVSCLSKGRLCVGGEETCYTFGGIQLQLPFFAPSYYDIDNLLGGSLRFLFAFVSGEGRHIQGVQGVHSVFRQEVCEVVYVE